MCLFRFIIHRVFVDDLSEGGLPGGPYRKWKPEKAHRTTDHVLSDNAVDNAAISVDGAVWFSPKTVSSRMYGALRSASPELQVPLATDVTGKLTSGGKPSPLPLRLPQEGDLFS